MKEDHPDRLKMVYAGSIATLSIIIPAHNEEKYILECLRSILRAKAPDVTEVIVVDNASADRTSEVAKSVPGIRVIREDRKGTSYARERGFRESTGELLAFIDADSLLAKGWMERAASWFEDDSVVCVSGPYLCHDFAKIWNLFSLCYWWLFAVPASWITGTVAVGGGMMIRRSALEQAGGFDTSVTFYGDDTSIAKRLKPVGTVRFDPRLIMWSSARRFKNEGLIRVALVYAWNFLSQAFTGRSVTKTNEDIR